jgi:hypothetical protein
MAGHNRQLSILAMNVNGLNAPIKRHSIANWVKKKKTRPNYVLLTRDSSYKHWLKVKGYKNVFQTNKWTP